VYVAPDGSYTATHPSVWRRVAAGAIDWVLCYVLFLIASIVAGVFQTLGWSAWTAGDLRGIPGTALLFFSQLVLAAPVVGYFAYYWRTGSTLGMRALDMELVRADTGKPPRWPRALARAALAFLLAIAVNNVYTVVASDPLDGYSTLERVVIGASLALVGLCAVAKLWTLVDRERRSLFDRAFGLLYVEEIVFSRTTAWPWTTSGRV
jgi:uncharacterized RDD family membrane protein YckC